MIGKTDAEINGNVSELVVNDMIKIFSTVPKKSNVGKNDKFSSRKECHCIVTRT